MSAPSDPPQVHGDGLTPPSEGAGASEALRAAEREALATVIHNGGCQCRGHALGWTIRSRDGLQLADAVLEAGYRREPPFAAEPNAYRIEITIPLGLPDALRERLFESVADVVHDWEPPDRVGWDAFVSGHAVYDELAEEVGQ